MSHQEKTTIVHGRSVSPGLAQGVTFLHRDLFKSPDKPVPIHLKDVEQEIGHQSWRGSDQRMIGKGVRMKRNIIMGLALILSVLTGLAEDTADSPQDHLLNLFPASVLDAFALQPDECPPAYARITDSNLLARAGITES